MAVQRGLLICLSVISATFFGSLIGDVHENIQNCFPNLDAVTHQVETAPQGCEFLNSLK